MTDKYEAVIGLEVHVELKTKSKAFCHCATSFGAEPNTHVCPICLGMPGVLPVLNRQMVEYALMTALALNCRIADYCKFDRKNYFYPDLPKNYQISQYDLPIARSGSLVIETKNGQRAIGINRVHMEEDAGKLVHKGNIITTPYSLVDLNRAGTPLLEIVSEPDLRSPGEARVYMEQLRLILLYLGVSDCKMEEGSLRCDANISVRPQGQQQLGTKTEIKNLNSFRSLERALDYEITRQIEALAQGERIIQETRTWDEDRQVTMSMRSKEEAHDYRYFPDPDLPPLRIDRDWVERVRRSLPELPEQARRRLSEEYNLSRYDALLLTASKDILDFFDDCVARYPKPKVVANWITGDLARLLNQSKLEIGDCRVTPALLVGLLKLLDEGTISGKIAKAVLEEMFTTGEAPDKIVKDRRLIQISDESAVKAIVDEVIAGNPKVVEDFRNGKDKALGFLVGQVMKASKGKANPELVNRLLREELSRR
ncbi:MAG: Asp-tRNA(Asn)/Glu-tRNA(Gln) amidotransferase subunit GatB [Syntrophomonadaceae bacterium]|nr:Asp-tRNA(Asn)/Glu-tRNA(Gln) amidotransferase subunit GatB [Syntrophomonadaceae bacterium]